MGKPRAAGRIRAKSERPWTSLFIGVFLAVQVAVPALYYVGEKREDERFRWRMFSSVRVELLSQPCQVGLEEIDAAGTARAVAVGREVPEAWFAALQRRVPRVAEGVLRWRCTRSDAAETVLTRVCPGEETERLTRECS